MVKITDLGHVLQLSYGTFDELTAGTGMTDGILKSQIRDISPVIIPDFLVDSLGRALNNTDIIKDASYALIRRSWMDNTSDIKIYLQDVFGVTLANVPALVAYLQAMQSSTW